MTVPYAAPEITSKIQQQFEHGDWRSRPREAFLAAFATLGVPTGEIGEGVEWGFLGPDDKPLGAFACVRDPTGPSPAETERRAVDFFYRLVRELPGWRAITTQREHVTALTKSLVADVAAGDTTKVEAALADDAKLYSPVNPAGMDKDRILSRIGSMLGPSGAVRVEDYALLECQVEPSVTGAVYIQAKVRVTAGGAPTISWWRLDAAPTGNTYKFTGIKFLSTNWNIPDLGGGGH